MIVAGKKTNGSLKNLKLLELSIVDNPANPGAKVSMYKRASPDNTTLVNYLAMKFLSFNDQMVATAYDEAFCDMQNELSDMYWALRDSIWSIRDDVSVDPTGKMTAIMASINQFVGALQTQYPAETKAAVTKAVLATKKDDSMTDKERIAELEKSVGELTTKLQSSTALVSTLTTEKSDLSAKLDTATKAQKALETDEVIKVGEVELRKSVVGDGVFMVIKAQQGQIATEKALREETEFVAKAAVDFGYLPGDKVALGKAYRALNSVPQADRDVIVTALKAGSAALQGKMGERGGNPPGQIGGSPDDQLEALAKAFAKDNKVSIVKARADVLDTPEGRVLYKQSLEQSPTVRQ